MAQGGAATLGSREKADVPAPSRLPLGVPAVALSLIGDRKELGAVSITKHLWHVIPEPRAKRRFGFRESGPHEPVASVVIGLFTPPLKLEANLIRQPDPAGSIRIPQPDPAGSIRIPL